MVTGVGTSLIVTCLSSLGCSVKFGIGSQFEPSRYSKMKSSDPSSSGASKSYSAWIVKLLEAHV